MASSTWYMSFTFTPPPPGFNSIIYLAFLSIKDPNDSNVNLITNWYNINHENCEINLNSEIYYNKLGKFSGDYTDGIAIGFGFMETSLRKLYIIGSPDYADIIGIPGEPDQTIRPRTNSDPQFLIYDPYPDPVVEYAGTYVFSKNTILPCCFSEGTRILGLTAQLKEEYRLVQNLLIGDFIKSYLHGYRKVSKILKGSFVNNPTEHGVANCMYRMSKTEDNGLIEDLTLTRNHGVLVEKLTEDEEKKVDKNNLPVIDGLLSIITSDSDKFEKVKDTNVYNYYHFSLDGDGDNDRRFGVYANGLLVETPSNNMMDGAMNIKPLDF